MLQLIDKIEAGEGHQRYRVRSLDDRGNFWGSYDEADEYDLEEYATSASYSFSPFDPGTETHPDDVVALVRAAQQDRAVFGMFYRRYRQRVSRYRVS